MAYDQIKEDIAREEIAKSFEDFPNPQNHSKHNFETTQSQFPILIRYFNELFPLPILINSPQEILPGIGYRIVGTKVKYLGPRE